MKTRIMKIIRKAIVATTLASSMVVSACAEDVNAAAPGDAQPVEGERAFPGAVGHGAAALGGHLGRIIQVTNRDDSGPGSLRNCLVARGKRVCVFTVGGVFRFTTRPPVIKNPYLTIAGQTAPGGGVTIAHAGGIAARTPIAIKNTHDIIVRHVRVRLDRLSANRESDDAFTIENSSNVIIDHVSGSWASDELINGYGDNDQVTISNSIFSFGIPRHDKCALLGSDPKGAQSLSFIGNICAHNGDRNPDINFTPGSCVEVVNNVLYNAQSEFAEIWESYGGTPVAVVGNTFVAGPDTHERSQGITRVGIASSGTAQIYMWDNNFSGDFLHVSGSAKSVQVERPPCPLTVDALPVHDAYEAALGEAGAWPRDTLDMRVVEEVRTRTGRIVDGPGEIPELQTGSPYIDDDRDGMDDEWEIAHGADPRVSDPWGDVDENGISNFEDFLSFRERTVREELGG